MSPPVSTTAEPQIRTTEPELYIAQDALGRSSETSLVQSRMYQETMNPWLVTLVTEM